MKKAQLCGFIFACALTLTRASAQTATAPSAPPVVYNPNLELEDDPSPLVVAAINSILSGEDDPVFINNIGRGQAEKFDEFSEQAGGNDQKIREEHRQALQQARAILKGEVELTYATHLTLYRYNPANKSFITASASPTAKLPWFANPAFDIKSDKFLRVKFLNILNANQVEAWELPPAQARKLGDYFTTHQGNKRQVIWRFKFRLRTDPADRVRNDLSGTGYDLAVAGYLTEVNFVFNDDSKFDPDITSTMKVHPYVRTEAELQMANALKYRMLGGDRTIMFMEGEACLYMNRDLRTNGQPMFVFDQPIIPWYLIGSKILFITPNGEVLQSYTFEDGKLAIEGVPYRPARFQHDKANNMFLFPEAPGDRF